MVDNPQENFEEGAPKPEDSSLAANIFGPGPNALETFRRQKEGDPTLSNFELTDSKYFATTAWLGYIDYNAPANTGADVLPQAIPEILKRSRQLV